MSCVIGLAQRRRVYIGADSGAVGSRFIRTTNLPKVFRRGPFLIGYVGSFRMGQVLEHYLDVPAQAPDEGEMTYMVTRFIDAVRDLLRAKGVMSIDHHKETGGQFLVGYRGRLYSVNSDFHVGDMADGFDAIGSGAVVALGALMALEGLAPRERITRALEIAAYYIVDVYPPFRVLSLGRQG
jgi:ATP-dependent protease HslVU (ClpYQ) peptidase subunit